MPPELFATLGVGGALAGVIFYFYHEAAKRHAQDMKLYTEQRTEDLKRMEAYMLASNARWEKIVINNTAAVTELREGVRNLAESIESLDRNRHGQ